MVQDEGEVLYPPPPVPHAIHALYGRPFLCGHGPQTQWAKGLHQMDQKGQLLSRIGGYTRPPPSVSSPGGGSTA